MRNQLRPSPGLAKQVCLLLLFFLPRFYLLSASRISTFAVSTFAVSFNLPLAGLNVYLLSTIGSSLYKPGTWGLPFILHQPNYSK